MNAIQNTNHGRKIKSLSTDNIKHEPQTQNWSHTKYICGCKINHQRTWHEIQTTNSKLNNLDPLTRNWSNTNQNTKLSIICGHEFDQIQTRSNTFQGNFLPGSAEDSRETGRGGRASEIRTSSTSLTCRRSSTSSPSATAKLPTSPGKLGRILKCTNYWAR